MNWLTIIVTGIVLISLVVFLVQRNWKDEKDFESQVNKDFHKSKDEEGDIDTEEVLK